MSIIFYSVIAFTLVGIHFLLVSGILGLNNTQGFKKCWKMSIAIFVATHLVFILNYGNTSTKIEGAYGIKLGDTASNNPKLSKVGLGEYELLSNVEMPTLSGIIKSDINDKIIYMQFTMAFNDEYAKDKVKDDIIEKLDKKYQTKAYAFYRLYDDGESSIRLMRNSATKIILTINNYENNDYESLIKNTEIENGLKLNDEILDL